jgi:hypothetical protein
VQKRSSASLHPPDALQPPESALLDLRDYHAIDTERQKLKPWISNEDDEEKAG